ncbi:hypothetical protein [Janthinobacterium svalbardensis]|uniref:hypothetical protein n=1 Tax=Janthinobacterium svalbardensis TaxID=368607 RepID=UPI002FCD7501
MNSFALAARYGTPASYQHLGEYLQLNYGSEAAGCQVIVLVDQQQRVASWSTSGARCNGGGQNGNAEPDLDVLDECPVYCFVFIPFKYQAISIQTLHHGLKKRLTNVGRGGIVWPAQRGRAMVANACARPDVLENKQAVQWLGVEHFLARNSGSLLCGA